MANWREIELEKKRRKEEIKSIKELHHKTVKSLEEKHLNELNQIPLLAQKEINKIIQQAKEMSKNEQQFQMLCKRIENQREEIENRIREKLVNKHQDQLRLSEEWKFESLSPLMTIAEYEEALATAKYVRRNRRYFQEEPENADGFHQREAPVQSQFYTGPVCPKCKSKDIFTDTKGYSVAKGVLGAAALGPVGLVGGMIGSKKPVKRCGNCGHTF